MKWILCALISLLFLLGTTPGCDSLGSQGDDDASGDDDAGDDDAGDDDTGPSGDDDDDPQDDDTGDDDTSGPWPINVTEVATPGNYTGDLGFGEMVDLDWADDSSVACFPGTENMNFDGNHVFFGTYQPDYSDLTVTVTPDAGVDVSVYLIQLGTTNYYVPPDVPSAVTCEAGYDQVNDANPGAPESAMVEAVNNPYNVLIGVAGAHGLTSGGFSMEIELDE